MHRYTLLVMVSMALSSCISGFELMACFNLSALAVGCSPSCGPNASCQDRLGRPVCVCNAGYLGDGYNCTGRSNCFTRTCINARTNLHTRTPGRHDRTWEDGEGALMESHLRSLL